jgi:hypothetical protein
MRLASLQKAVARAIMQPLTRTERMQRSAPGGGLMRSYAARYIKPNDRLTSFERLEIYNRQYWFRLLSSMREDFPGLRAVLGEAQFESMCKAYLTDCPSRSFTLRNLGAKLATWLRQHPYWMQDKQFLALDMVRLEWADVEAFDGQAKPALRSERLAGITSAKVHLSLQPYVQLLQLHNPVDDLLLGVKDSDDDGSNVASNAFHERKKRRKVRAVAKLHPEHIFLVVHRLEFSVYFRRIEPEEYFLLVALSSGRPIQSAIELAFRKSSIPEAERAVSVQHWFQTWTTLGWFCHPENINVPSENSQKKGMN